MADGDDSLLSHARSQVGSGVVGLDEAIQAVDTLTEFVQGPCRANQMVVVGVKAVDTATKIMAWTRKDLLVRVSINAHLRACAQDALHCVVVCALAVPWYLWTSQRRGGA